MPPTDLAEQAAAALARLRDQRPLVHHITNSVAISYTADATRQLGAAPIMTAASDEVAEMVAQAGALLLNMGTPTQDRLQAMMIAGRQANRSGVPVVLDPVGVGATKFRTEAVAQLLESVRMAVVCGNAAEIGELAGSRGGILGVEALAAGDIAPETVGTLARRLRGVVAVTGPEDLVTDGRRALRVTNGHSRMASVVGTGCMATTAIACFAAVEPDYLVAAVAGLAAIGLTGERAAGTGVGAGGFRSAMIDALAELTPHGLQVGAAIRGEALGH